MANIEWTDTETILNEFL